MRRDRHPTIQPTKPMRPIKLHRTPLFIRPIHPVEPPPRIRNPNRQQILPARFRRCSQIALKRQLLHNRVAHQLLIQINLSPQMCPTHMQKDSLPRHRRRNINLPPPPRHSKVSPILRNRIIGRVAILLRRIRPRLCFRPRPKLPPKVLLHGRRQHHRDPRTRTQHAPPARRSIRRQFRQIPRTTRPHILRQKNRVVFPLRRTIHPKPPTIIRHQRPILRPRLPRRSLCIQFNGRK